VRFGAFFRFWRIHAVRPDQCVKLRLKHQLPRNSSDFYSGPGAKV
jgi:hypothetical protein